MKVRFSLAAQRDIGSAVRYLADRNPHAAHRLNDDVIAAAESLDALPYRGREGRNGLRRIVCGKYLIFYKVSSGEVLIARIVHGARLSAAILSEDE